MANTSGSRSNRGFIIVLCILVAAAVAAFMAMRETIDPGSSPAPVVSGQTTQGGQPGNQTGSQPGSQPGSQAGSQASGQAGGYAGTGAAGQVPGQTPGQVPGQGGEQPSGQAAGQVPGQIPGQAGGQASGQAAQAGQASGQAGGSGQDRTQFQGRVQGLSDTDDPSQANGAYAPGLSPYPSQAGQAGQSGQSGHFAQAGQAGQSGQSYPVDVPYPAAETPEQTQGGGPLNFTNDMALFLVNNYWPKGTHPAATTGGISTAGLKTANMRYGTESRGIRLDGNTSFKGAAALSRFFTPGVLDSLYGNYADEFLASMRESAASRRIASGSGTRPLSETERREMYGIYASRARGLASVLTAYADNPGIRVMVEELHYAESAVDAANRDYMESMGEYEIALEDKSPDLAAAKALRDQDAAVYQDRIKAREAARDALAAALGRALDEDSRIYAASWAYRRGNGNVEVLKTSAKILNDLGAKLAAEAR